ncbi:MAG TPA: AAA family ATPase [Casimicrobiaceae bacterium]|nr:AAA family ATPase [Casimicrobiaceae bacterium]
MLLAGDPGVGKSQVALDVAARITRGGEWSFKRLQILRMNTAFVAEAI